MRLWSVLLACWLAIDGCLQLLGIRQGANVDKIVCVQMVKSECAGACDVLQQARMMTLAWHVRVDGEVGNVISANKCTQMDMFELIRRYVLQCDKVFLYYINAV